MYFRVKSPFKFVYDTAMQTTALHACHLEQQGKLVDFCGWHLPIHYGSQLKEHECVRTHHGMFDVSHMRITDITGVDARKLLRILLSNDVAKLERYPIGKALYSAMLNAAGGIIDDLIVYRRATGYRLVTNAATYQKDFAWLSQIAQDFTVELQPRPDLAIIAVQGPVAITTVATLKPHLATALQALKSFESLEDQDWQYARTGYTGESGLEVIIPASQAPNFWQQLLAANVVPCGLAARDTLRLEAGLNLYGHDMDETVGPAECNIDFAVDVSDPQRHFIGREVYQTLQASGAARRQIGLSLATGGILREGQKVFSAAREVGVITSGTFSPTLKRSIAMARVTHAIDQAEVEIRGQRLAVEIVGIPFVRATHKSKTTTLT